MLTCNVCVSNLAGTYSVILANGTSYVIVLSQGIFKIILTFQLKSLSSHICFGLHDLFHLHEIIQTHLMPASLPPQTHTFPLKQPCVSERVGLQGRISHFCRSNSRTLGSLLRSVWLAAAFHNTSPGKSF